MVTCQVTRLFCRCNNENEWYQIHENIIRKSSTKYTTPGTNCGRRLRPPHPSPAHEATRPRGHEATRPRGHEATRPAPQPPVQLQKVLEVVLSQLPPAGLLISLQLLRGDLEQLCREKPALSSRGVAVSRKLGIPEVIMPGE